MAEKNPSKFASQFAHDIKNPLGNALMYNDLLLSELEEADHPAAGQRLMLAKNMQLSLQSLMFQIDTWAAAIHLHQGAYSLEKKPCDATALCLQVIARHRTFFKRKNVQMDTHFPDQPALVLADSFLLEMVLENLISMMLLFANYDDTVRIGLSTHESTRELWLEDMYSGDRSEITARIQNGVTIAVDEPVEGGMLKPAGYGMMLCGEVSKTLDVPVRVEETNAGGLRVGFQFPLA